jgi:hypothetical protein
VRWPRVLLRSACAPSTRMVPFIVFRMRSRTARGKERTMNRLALLVPVFLACSRTPLGLHVPDGGSPGMGGAGGSVEVPPASGGSPAESGAGDSSPGHIGGAGGVGGKPATGGMPGTGGSPSASGGSVSSTDLDTCSSDADCTSCLWGPAPTDPSQCPGYINCCGGMSATQKRCEANHGLECLLPRSDSASSRMSVHTTVRRRHGDFLR